MTSAISILSIQKEETVSITCLTKILLNASTRLYFRGISFWREKNWRFERGFTVIHPNTSNIIKHSQLSDKDQIKNRSAIVDDGQNRRGLIPSHALPTISAGLKIMTKIASLVVGRDSACGSIPIQWRMRVEWHLRNLCSRFFFVFFFFFFF